MNRIEERLQDALQASAARVRDDRLRPFARRAARRQAWRTWLIPAAAALSVLLVIGLVAAVSSGLKDTTGHRTVSPAESSGIPAYMADFEPTIQGVRSVVVRSTSTGTVVATARTPLVKGWQLTTDSVAAAPDDRTFYAEFDAIHEVGSSAVQQIWIYRLTITGSGSATPLTRIKGGEISGFTRLGFGGSMVVSPGGTKLALTADSTDGLTNNIPGWADKIIVVDLRAGVRSDWQGGLYRSGKTFTIPYISWSRDGRSLVFLGLWCSFPAAANLCLGGGSDTQAYRDTQVRSLIVSTGGALDRSAVLLRQSTRYPVIAAALAGPAGPDLTVLVLSGRLQYDAWSRIAMDHVPVTGGSLPGVDYRGPAQGGEGQPDTVWLGADPSGKYVLLGYGGPHGYVLGWLANGAFHRQSSLRYTGGAVTW